jgi:hypothetical protein
MHFLSSRIMTKRLMRNGILKIRKYLTSPEL